MRKFYFKQLLTTLLLLCSSAVSAQDFTCLVETDTCGLKELLFTIINEEDATVEITSGLGSGMSYNNYIRLNPYSGYSQITIPGEVTDENSGKTYTVTGIADNAFRGCIRLTNVVIPGSITTIGEYAFGGCEALAEIIIPEGVNTIKLSAFNNCAAMTSVTIPTTLKMIGRRAFYGCSAIETVNISNLEAWCNVILEKIISINPILTENFSSPLFNYLYGGIPDSYGGWTQTFGKPRHLMLNGERVTDIVIDLSKQGSGWNGCSGHFAGCSAESITFIGGGNIDTYAFAGMTNLKKVILPEGKNSQINFGAFLGCSNLTELTIRNQYIWPYNQLQTGNQLYISSPEIETFQDVQKLSKLTLCENVATLEDIFGPMFSPFATNPGYLEIDTLEIGNVTKIEPRIRPKKVINYANKVAWYNSTLDLENPDCEVLIAGKPVEPEYDSVLVIPEGTTIIRAEKIAGEHITKIVLPESIIYIPSNAFENCPNLIEFNIPENVETIGINAFRGTAWYDAQPDGLIYKGNWLVDYKGELSGNINIKDSTEYIVNNLFAGCTLITGATLPARLTTIGARLFDSCTGLTSITIPGNVTTIGTNAFNGCTGLASITIPGNVTTIDAKAFNGCTGLTSITIPGNVTTIGANAFNGCTGLTSITIPGNVTTIGANAFNGCTGLTNVEIFSDSIEIGYGAFGNCSTIREITIPGEFSSTVYKTFPHSPIGKAIITEGSTFIANSLFQDCEYLTEAVIPASITKVGRNVFTGTAWYNAQPDGFVYKDGWLLGYKGDAPTDTIAIPEGTMNIADYAFEGCISLFHITLPASIGRIGEYAFYNCGITYVRANSTTPMPIANNTFSNRNNITLQINIGTGTRYATTDGWSNFGTIIASNEIDDIEYIAIDEDNYTVALNRYNRADSIVNNLPCKIYINGDTYNVTAINGEAFSKNTAIQIVEIPEGVTAIGSDAFSGCKSLHTVYLPTTLTSMAAKAIYPSTTALTAVYSKATTPAEIVRTSFATRTYTTTTLYVPIGTKATYAATINWKSFKNIVEMDFAVRGDVDGDGTIDVADVTTLVGLILGSDTKNSAADVDGDGTVDVADVTELVTIILGE